MTDRFKIFHDAVNDRPALASQIQGQRKIIGHLCSYTPEELVHAAGFHPMRLFSSKSDIIMAEEHLQAYCCSLVRGVLEDSLSGRLDFLSGTVFPHTCDSIQRLSDIWRMKAKYEFFADVLLPAKLDTESARTYMVDLLNRFKADLENASGNKITDEILNNSISIFNRIRQSLSRIYSLQSEYPGIIRGSDLYALIRGAMVMDRKTAAYLLEQIADELGEGPFPEEDQSATRIILTGSICDSPGFYQAIEDGGGVVVGDDLCTGQRWFDGLVEETGDPVAAIADRYITRINCPAKHISNTFRGEHLVSLAKKNRAQGVVFALLKFCDPHEFDYPYLKDFLDKEGIRHTLIEMDDQQETLGQLSTRLETFIHMAAVG